MKRMFALIGAAMLLVALTLVVRVPVARAHAEIESCTPPMDGVVETAPDKLVCKSSEGMDPSGSKLSVFDAGGMQVDKGDSQVDLNDPDRATIGVSLDSAMMKDGVYTVKWVTLSADDGDSAEGEFKLTVGHAMMMGDMTATPGATSEEEEHEDHRIAHATVDGKEVTLKVVAPPPGATLAAGDVTIEATVEGLELGTNGSHLHFYVDDKLAAMGEGNQTQLTVKLEPGAHDLAVTLAGGEHGDLAKAHVHVTVEAAVAAQATTAAPTDVPTTEPTAVPTSEPTTAPPSETATPSAGEPSALPSTGTSLPILPLLLIGGLGALILVVGVGVRARR